MWEFIATASKILPVILLFLLGYALRRTRFVSPQVIEGMKKIAVNIALPLVIFNSLVRLEFRFEYFALAPFVLGILILLLLAGIFFRRVSKSPNPYLPSLFTSFENGMIGYGIMAVAFGPENIYPIVILDLGQTLFFSLVFVPFTQRVNMGEAAPRLKLKELILSFAKNSFVLATAAALFLNLTGLVEFTRAFPPFAAVLESAELVSALSTPLICLVVGYELRIKLTTLPVTLKVVALRLAVMLPAAVLFDQLIIKRLLSLDIIFSQTVIAMFMLPPFFIGALLINDRAVKEREFSLSVISAHIVVFLVLFSFYNGLLLRV